MNIIVDANIIFSGILILRKDRLLINLKAQLRFIAPDFLRTEIRHHYPKLTEISKLPLGKIQEASSKFTKTLPLSRKNKLS